MAKIVSFQEFKEKYPNGRMKTPPKPKAAIKAPEPVPQPLEVPLVKLAIFQPEANQAALWDQFKKAAIAAVEFRDCESVDECVLILQALRTGIEITIPE